MADLGISTVILQITTSDDAAASALGNPLNEAYLVPAETIALRQSRSGTPFAENQPVTAVLRTTDFPFDPALGFVFGRKDEENECNGSREGDNGDDETTDIAIGTKGQGISRKHFSIDFNWEARTLLIKNLSANGTLWTDPETGMIERLMTTRVLLEAKQYRVSAGVIDLILRIPVRDEHQRTKYDAEIQRLYDEVRQATPTLNGLKLRSLGSITPMFIGKNRKYTRGCIIGTGATAIVYEVFDYETGNRFAAKDYSCDTEPEMKSMFREIKLLQELKHEHIVQCIDTFKDPDPIVVMEFAPTLLLHVLAGLAYLHKERILHRDVKPANILQITEEPQFWKLADFGLSKRLETGAPGTSTFCGSKLYLAPEVDELSYSLYTEAVDIWSVGIVGVEYSVGLGSAIKEREKEEKWYEAVYKRSECSSIAPYLLIMLDKVPGKRPSARTIWLKLKDRDCDENIKIDATPQQVIV